ncbi:MAG: hypothetical protein LWY06_17300 [Firmicutes bacterium]|nr:hypothetical protein [Bacillota bacterium]
MNSIDRISSTGANFWATSIVSKQADQNPTSSAPTDVFSLSGAQSGENKAAKASEGNELYKAATAASKEISLEKIDTAMEAASTPIGDAALLSTVTNVITSGKTMNAKGTITQGGKKYDVSLNLQGSGQADTGLGNILGERGYDYKLTGKVGNMPMNVHCYSSGLSLYLEGTIGENKVALKNSYSILSGKISTTGTIGSVPVNLESKAKDNVVSVNGDIGGSAFSEKLTQYSNGSKAEGKLGNLTIAGSSTTGADGIMNTTSQMGDIISKYEVKLQ